MDRVSSVLATRYFRLAQIRAAAFEVLNSLVVQARANEHFKHRLGNVRIDLDHPVLDELVEQRAEQVQVVHLAGIRVRHVRYVRVLVPAPELQVDLRTYRLPRALLFKRRPVRVPANIDKRYRRPLRRPDFKHPHQFPHLQRVLELVAPRIRLDQLAIVVAPKQC
ncbi:hypothetical protein AYI69_g3234 [Smittium culicis]|uniref:Uncharacterized protein n=1 Tax=Smittium culicis TaxID=133412 RepID=A0A1R1YKL3_9FUNG|nr:hypothetical protein AYI69_g3234 [Smittium culicis]